MCIVFFCHKTYFAPPLKKIVLSTQPWLGYPVSPLQMEDPPVCAILDVLVFCNFSVISPSGVRFKIGTARSFLKYYFKILF